MNTVAALSRLPVQYFDASVQPSGGLGSARTQTLAAELPVALVFNGVSHAVMMATPADLEDFALGFALSEGILDRPDQCYEMACRQVDAQNAALPPGLPGMELHLRIANRCFERLKGRRRSMSGRTGCGVCGVESFAALDLRPQPLTPRDWLARVDLTAVLTAAEALPERQRLNAQSGALHAAGWASLDQGLVEVMEDVGRHNALDKLLGRLARSQRLQQPGFVLMSSRGSHELVRKCARLGVAAMACVSAPTVTGVRVAELAGLRLWGLCRPPQALLYSAGTGLAPVPGAQLSI